MMMGDNRQIAAWVAKETGLDDYYAEILPEHKSAKIKELQQQNQIVAIPLAAGVLYDFGILLSPAVGAVLMSFSTVIVAVNAKLLKIK